METPQRTLQGQADRHVDANKRISTIPLTEGTQICKIGIFFAERYRRIIKPRRMRWAGYVARMGEKRNEYRIKVGKPDGRRPLGRPKRRWVDSIKMDLRAIRRYVMD
jgi:hypothetical protein